MKSVSFSPHGGKQKRFTVSHGGIWSYSHGTKLRKTRLVVIPRTVGANSRKRGQITAFSKQSADRLRRAILTLSHPDLGLLCGLTLTLPWQFDGSAIACQLDAYKDAWHTFQKTSPAFVLALLWSSGMSCKRAARRIATRFSTCPAVILALSALHLLLRLARLYHVRPGRH